ncbi:MAG: hypothetical protein KIT69_04370 [Propionibacteriaceae bacterium]|nr:hypothetical protein [Propionibacteriaceae bacterium]
MQTNADAAATLAALIPLYLFILAIAVVEIVALWKVFAKAGEPGWAAIVPIYNIYTMVKIAGYNPLMFLLFLIPLVNIVFGIMVMIRIGSAFGKSTGWSIVMLVIFNIVGMLILGFGQDQYRNPLPAQY